MSKRLKWLVCGFGTSLFSLWCGSAIVYDCQGWYCFPAFFTSLIMFIVGAIYAASGVFGGGEEDE